jgi:hypothetical protein
MKFIYIKGTGSLDCRSTVAVVGRVRLADSKEERMVNASFSKPLIVSRKTLACRFEELRTFVILLVQRQVLTVNHELSFNSLLLS